MACRSSASATGLIVGVCYCSSRPATCRAVSAMMASPGRRRSDTYLYGNNPRAPGAMPDLPNRSSPPYGPRSRFLCVEEPRRNPAQGHLDRQEHGMRLSSAVSLGRLLQKSSPSWVWGQRCACVARCMSWVYISLRACCSQAR